MKWKQPFFLLLLLVVGGQAYAGSALEFSFTSLDGKTYTSESLKDTPLVVNIGSHWWKKCKDEAPELQRAYLAYKEKGVLFLGAFAMSKEKDIKKFAKKYQLTYPVGMETGIAEALGANGIPETIFIAKGGRVVKKITDTIRYQELVAGIEKILE